MHGDRLVNENAGLYNFCRKISKFTIINMSIRRVGQNEYFLKILSDAPKNEVFEGDATKKTKNSTFFYS